MCRWLALAGRCYQINNIEDIERQWQNPRTAGPGQNLRLVAAHHARTTATRAGILLPLVHFSLSISLFHAASSDYPKPQHIMLHA